jgi:very-short-patch-repair endonuclease
MREVDRIIHELASSQHGTFTRAQARSVGVTRNMLATRVRRGDLRTLGPEVLALSGAPVTDQLFARAAVSSVEGSALSHSSAAAVWKLPGYRVRPLEITSARPRRISADSPLAAVHTTTFLPDDHVAVVDGIRVTVPARVLFDLAGDLHPARLERLIDTAWRMGLVTGRLLRVTLDQLAERGRPGIQTMRVLIEARSDDYRPTGSNAEGRFESLMHQVGITTFERQVDVGGADWLGRMDFRDRLVPLIVEVDSETFHGSLVDRANDERRRAALRELGFELVVVQTFDLWHRPHELQARVLEARRNLSRQRTQTRR